MGAQSKPISHSLHITILVSQSLQLTEAPFETLFFLRPIPRVAEALPRRKGTPYETIYQVHHNIQAHSSSTGIQKRLIGKASRIFLEKIPNFP